MTTVRARSRLWPRMVVVLVILVLAGIEVRTEMVQRTGDADRLLAATAELEVARQQADQAVLDAMVPGQTEAAATAASNLAQAQSHLGLLEQVLGERTVEQQTLTTQIDQTRGAIDDAGVDIKRSDAEVDDLRACLIGTQKALDKAALGLPDEVRQALSEADAVCRRATSGPRR